MTPEQRSDWNLYSCVPRCIIELANLRGKQISDIEFAAKYGPGIPDWNSRFGLTPVEKAVDIAVDLGISTTALVMPDCDSLLKHFQTSAPDFALVITRKTRDRQTGKLVELNHCRLLIGGKGEYFSLYNPTQNGGAVRHWIPKAILEEEEACFVLL